MALHANSSLICMHCRISDSLKYTQKHHMAYMQHKKILIDLRYTEPFCLATSYLSHNRGSGKGKYMRVAKLRGGFLSAYS